MGCCSNKETDYFGTPRYTAILTIIAGIIEILQEAFELMEMSKSPNSYPGVFKAYIVIVFLFGPIHVGLGILLLRGAIKRDTNLIRRFLYISTPVYLIVCIVAIALYVEMNKLAHFSEQKVALIVFKICVMWLFQLGVFWSYKKIIQKQGTHAIISSNATRDVL